MRTPEPINSSTEIPPPPKKKTGNIYTYKLCDICFSYLKTTSELQLLQPVDGRFLVLPFQHTKGGLYIWYLQQVSVVDFGTR